MTERPYLPGGYIPGVVYAAPLPGERIVPAKNIQAVNQIGRQLSADEIDEDEYMRRWEELTVPWAAP